MCGICGVINLDRNHPVGQSLIGSMTGAIAHRGPDAQGLYVSGHVGLGHRRLSIIDLSTGEQPMSNEDDSIWVVYNGEIYNYLELRDELIAKGHHFKSASDTEVIIHLYEELGVDSINKFQGMFAFALWDEKKQLLVIARDRIGIKPLYFTQTSTSFLFASEIKSILNDANIDRELNYNSIDTFLTYHYLPGSETLFKKIHKLEPGYFITVRNGEVIKKRYWDLNFHTNSDNLDFQETVEELRVLLRKTVRSHMISDVPVGVLLSGGVDSTGVLRYAAEETDKPLHSFTIGFAGKDFADERPYALIAARKFGTTHHEVTMTADDFGDFLPRYVWHMEEPVCEPPAIALYYLAKCARDASVKVLLSGEGGDEAFGGYPNYRNLLLLERLKNTFGTKKRLLKSILQCSGRRFRRYAHLVECDISEYYLSRTALPEESFNAFKSSLYSDDFKDIIAGNNPNYETQRLFEKTENLGLLNQMLYTDTKTWLPDDLLVKADKMTMATSVELRVPLLDFHILEMAAGLPENFKVNGWTLKRILKSALEDSVPGEILNRKKTGFPVPYDSWLRNELRELVHDTVLSDNSCINAVFNPEKIHQLVTEFQNTMQWSKEIFCLMVLELWHQQFLES